MRLAIILAALTLSSPAAAATLVPPNAEAFSVKRDAETCAAQPDVAWCGGKTSSSAPDMSGMRAYGAIRKAEESARRTFSLREMPVDIWRSYASEAQAGQAWADDCSGLASTVVDLLAREGWPKGDVYRVLVATHGKGADHMVGAVVMPSGRVMVVGDTLRDKPYEWGEMVYDVKAVSPVAGGAVWYEYRR